jgi:hypothetical protein
MTTDFNYGNTAITSAGPFKPKNRNVPMNARYRVEKYADIATIPVPAVGELIFVLSDENNANKQNIYVIKSLKASNLGVADSLVDEVVPLKTFLGTEDIDLSDYATEDELNTSLSTKVDKVSGYSLVSDTEIARLANVDNYDDTELMNLIPDKTSDLENDSKFISSDDEIDADKINGRTISGPMTKEEYDAIVDKDPNTIYLVDDVSSIDGLPSYTVGDANKALTVNSNGTSIGWNDVNVYLDNYYTKSEVEERIANVSTGGSVDLSSYATKNYVDTEIDNIDIPTKVSQLENDRNYLTSIPSEYITETEMNEAISNIVLDSGNITFRDIEENEIFISGNNTVVDTYGNIIVSPSSITINEGSTGAFTVKLDKAPTSNQEVKLNVNNDNCNIDKNSLIFTPSNYSTTQTITVTGKTDSSSYVDKASIITLSSSNVSSKTVSVTIVNTDVQKELSSISAVYTQGNTVVYPNSSLDDLKQGLVVTATYSDSTSNVVTAYTLSGELTEGTSTITVDYQGKTATFNVTVSAKPILPDDGRTALFLLKDMKANASQTYDAENSTNIVTIKNQVDGAPDWIHSCVTAANKTEGADAISSVVDEDGLHLADTRAFGKYEIENSTWLSGTKEIEFIIKPINESFVTGENGTGTVIFGMYASNGWNVDRPYVKVMDNNILDLQLIYNSSTNMKPTITTGWNIITYVWDGTEDSTVVVPHPGAHLIVNGIEIQLTDYYGTLSYINKLTSGYLIGNKNYNIKEIGFYSSSEDVETVIDRHNNILSNLNN